MSKLWIKGSTNNAKANIQGKGRTDNPIPIGEQKLFLQ